MKVILATAHGMCFGVRDAIALAHGLEQPQTVTIHGELVHNPDVNRGLEKKGFVLGDRASMPGTERVLITAHGISERERTRLTAAGKSIIDATCPLVTRAHHAARRLAADGWFVVLIGRPGHVEVQGIVEDLVHYAVVPSAAAVTTWPHARIGVICQTTTAPSDVDPIVRAIRSCNPGREVRLVDTICKPTRARQQAVVDILPRIDALIVVGGKNSNNTKQLGALAAQHGVPWHHVESAADVDAEWQTRYKVVGLTAGTSTPDATLREVQQALNAHAPRRRRVSAIW